MFTYNGEKQENVTPLRDEAMKCHYIGQNINDVKSFIDLVIRDADVLKENRTHFFNEYLLPKNGTDVALNIYNDIIKTLKL